jgi:NADH pyrophosphatase NudC (nudix superfamily)
MAEAKFVPAPGQVDYTDIRYAPCIKVIVVRNGKILLAKRAEDRRLYPGYWDTFDGFLDDKQSIEEKAVEELREEAGIAADDIAELKRGQMVVIEAPDYGKTWLLMPVQATVQTKNFSLDWEATHAQWFDPKEVKDLPLTPGSLEIIGQFVPEVL